MYDDHYDTYERELTFHSIEDSRISFDLFYFRLGAINCDAKLNGNTANFVAEEMGVEGRITLDNEQVIVEITSSTFEYMPVETLVFNARHRGIFDGGRGEDEINTFSAGSICDRCGWDWGYKTECDCTWCDICNAWVRAHSHTEEVEMLY